MMKTKCVFSVEDIWGDIDAGQRAKRCYRFMDVERDMTDHPIYKDSNDQTVGEMHRVKRKMTGEQTRPGS